eukprot:gene6546-8328_t
MTVSEVFARECEDVRPWKPQGIAKSSIKTAFALASDVGVDESTGLPVRLRAFVLDLPSILFPLEKVYQHQKTRNCIVICKDTGGHLYNDDTAMLVLLQQNNPNFGANAMRDLIDRASSEEAVEIVIDDEEEEEPETGADASMEMEDTEGESDAMDAATADVPAIFQATPAVVVSSPISRPAPVTATEAPSRPTTAPSDVDLFRESEIGASVDEDRMDAEVPTNSSSVETSPPSSSPPPADSTVTASQQSVEQFYSEIVEVDS